MLVTGAEVLALLTILPVAIVGRMFFGKRWSVQVRRGWTLEREERVGDWTRSGRHVRAAAKEITTARYTSRTTGGGDGDPRQLSAARAN